MKVNISQVTQGRYIVFEASNLDLPEGRSICRHCQGHGKAQRTYHGTQITEKDYDTCDDCRGSGHLSKPGRPQTCPLRAFTPLFDSEATDVDRWDFTGNDLTCSFCGSLHPDDFKRLCEESITNDKFSISLNDHRNKVYVRRPNIPNASVGGIKFMTAHIPKDRQQEFQDIIKDAIKEK